MQAMMKQTLIGLTGLITFFWLVATSPASLPASQCSATTPLDISCHIKCEKSNISCSASMFELVCTCENEYGKIEYPEKALRTLDDFSVFCREELSSKMAQKMSELTVLYIKALKEGKPKMVASIGKKLDNTFLLLPTDDKKKVIQFFNSKGYKDIGF